MKTKNILNENLLLIEDAAVSQLAQTEPQILPTAGSETKAETNPSDLGQETVTETDEAVDEEIEEEVEVDEEVEEGAAPPPTTETQNVTEEVEVATEKEKKKEQDAKEESGFDSPLYITNQNEIGETSVPRDLGLPPLSNFAIKVYIPTILRPVAQEETCCVQDLPIKLTYNGILIFTGDNEKYGRETSFLISGENGNYNDCCCEIPPPPEPNYCFTYTNCNGEAYVDITIKIPCCYGDFIQSEGLNGSECYKTVEYRVYVLPEFLPDCECDITQAISDVIKAESIYDFVAQTEFGMPTLQSFGGEEGNYYHTHFIDDCGVCWSIMPVYTEGSPDFAQIQGETYNLYLVPFCLEYVEYDSICRYSNSYENYCGYFYNSSSDGYYGYYSNSGGVETYADIYVNINFAELQGDTILLFNFSIYGSQYDINSSHWGNNEINLAIDLPDDMGFDANSLNQFILCSQQFFNEIFSTENSKEILSKIGQDINPDNQLSAETTLCIALEFLQQYAANTQNLCSDPGYGVLEDIFNNTYKLCVDGEITTTPFQSLDLILTNTYMTNVVLCEPNEVPITNICLNINYCGSDIVDRFNCWQKHTNCDSPYGNPLEYVSNHLNAHYVNDGTQAYIEINYDKPTNCVDNGYSESQIETLRICVDPCDKAITELTINADALFQNYYENGYVNFCELLNPYNEAPLFYLEDECGNCYEVKPSYEGEEGPFYCNLELLPCCCKDPVYGSLINQVHNVCLNGNTISTSNGNEQYLLDFSYIHNECGTFLKVSETYYASGSECPQTSCELIDITGSDLDCCCTINNFVLDANDLSEFVYNFNDGENSTPITINDFLNYFSNCGNLVFYDCEGNCFNFSQTYYDNEEGLGEGEGEYEYVVQPCNSEYCCEQNICVEFENNEAEPTVAIAQNEQDCFDQFFDISFVDCNDLTYLDFTWHYNQFEGESCGEFTPENCFNFPIYTNSLLVSVPDDLELSCKCSIEKIVIPQEYQCDFKQFFQDCCTLSDSVNACTGNQFVELLSCDRILLESTCGINYIIDKTCQTECKDQTDYVLVEVGNVVRTTTYVDENGFGSSYTFTNFQDDLAFATTGDGYSGLSLREAIILANNYSSNIDTILLQNGTYTLTIEGISEGQCYTGDLDVLTDLQIIGGCDGTTIDANRLDRAFQVGGGEGDFSTLTLRDLSVQNGYIIDQYGGGVYLNPYSNLELDNASIRYCETNETEASEGGPQTVIGGFGGGVYASEYNNVTLNDCSDISSNTSGYGGGVALGYQSYLTLNDSSRIAQNTAAYSGGGVNQQYFSSTTLNDNGAIDSNYVTNGGGGGVSSYYYSTVTLNNESEIAYNSSNAGAGIYDQFRSSINLNDASSIHNNTANNLGGGLYTYYSFVNLNDDSTIAYNSANSLWGGGIYDSSSSGINLYDNSLITNNYAGSDGGGIFGYYPVINLYNNSGITSNYANSSGGGIYDYYATTTLYDNSSISNNSVANGSGGGVYDYQGYITLQGNSEIDNNSAYSGGGVYNYFTIMSLYDSASINNNSAYDGGGAYSIYSNITLNNSSSIYVNHAINDGGGINAYSSSITLNDSSTITQNIADYDNDTNGSGGGIFDQASSNSITGGAAVTGNSPDQIATPLVLDLNHDNAIQLISLENSSVAWDLNNDGNVVKMGWVGPEDGILVYDKNHDSQVNDVSEFMFSLYSKDAKTDMEGLKLAFDSNQDGVFDNKDEHFNDFGVWQDLNSDGKTDANEYRSLIDWGIQSVSLTSDNVPSVEQGNIIFGHSTYQTTDGNTYKVADVGLAVGEPILSMNDVINPQDTINNLSSTASTSPLQNTCASCEPVVVEQVCPPPIPVQSIEEQPVICVA